MNAPGKEYECLEKKINSICSVACKYVESSWIVKYAVNASDLSKKLRECFDSNDHILVIKVVYDKQGWFPEEHWVKI